MTKQLLIISFFFFLQSSMASTFFVTENGAGTMDGTSWSQAASANQLQTIINLAMIGDEVWVACGTYVPTTTTNRSISFSMQNGVQIYGGFQGTESTLAERDLTCLSCSILSGEIGSPGIADNSYTVVYNQELNNTAILDGFIIRDGNDSRNPSSAGNGLGGGIYNHGFGFTGFCNPVIRNVFFTNNRASWGGGAFNNGYASGHTEPTYINCIFYQNHAYIEAGGMDTYAVGGHGSPTVINTLFYENTSNTNVGAMYAWGGNNGNCQPVLINCAFINNHALNGYGGAFIADNLNEGGGGSSGTCTVSLFNCVMWGNTATGVGQQFYIRGTGGQVVARYSDIDMSGQPSPHIISGPGTGNIDTPPLFRDIADPIGPDMCWLTEDDGLIPQFGSPLLNAGSITEIPTDFSDFDHDGDVLETIPLDIHNQSRLSACEVEMGPYEYEAPAILFIDSSAIGAGTGRTWTDALITFPPSVESTCNESQEIHIAKGTYDVQDSLFMNRPMTIRGSYAPFGGAQDLDLYTSVLRFNNAIQSLLHMESSGDSVILQSIILDDEQNINSEDIRIISGTLEMQQVEIRE